MTNRLDNSFFIIVIACVTLALGWIIMPFFGAILWGIVAAILFDPLYVKLRGIMPSHRNGAAGLTLLAIVATVVVPAIIVGILLVQEITNFYNMVRDGQIDFAAMFQHFRELLPRGLVRQLNHYGLMNFEGMRDKLVTGLTSSFQTIASQALSIGQGAFGFFVTTGVALYLAFFLLRDGHKIAARIDGAVPLPQQIRAELAGKIIAVTRATINGSVVVAIVQGLIGGIIFALLDIPGALIWGVVMAFFSLLPAIGTGLVWVPVAVYLLVSGQIWQGVVLVGCGVFIIGLVDNVLRPILVGRGTRIPDYMVLISTLGGLEIFGFNGIIIGPMIAAVFLSVWEIFAEARARRVAATPPTPLSG